MPRFSLRELVFSVVAAGALVGMVVNNYWWGQQLKRATIDRHRECLKSYVDEISVLEQDNTSLCSKNRELTSKLDNFIPMIRDSSGIWSRWDNLGPVNNSMQFYINKDSRVIYVRKNVEPAQEKPLESEHAND